MKIAPRTSPLLIFTLINMNILRLNSRNVASCISIWLQTCQTIISSFKDKKKSTIASSLAGSNLISALRITLCEFLWTKIRSNNWLKFKFLIRIDVFCGTVYAGCVHRNKVKSYALIDLLKVFLIYMEILFSNSFLNLFLQDWSEIELSLYGRCCILKQQALFIDVLFFFSMYQI